MSYTKKVTTYGRKKTSIYTVRPDLTPEPKRTTATKPIYVDSDSDDAATITPAKPTKSSRPPLTTLNSQQNILAVGTSTPEMGKKGAGKGAANGKGKGKSNGKAALGDIVESSSEEKIKPPRGARGRRVIPPTPSTVASASTATPIKQKQVFDCIELRSRAKSTIVKEVFDLTDLTTELEEIQLTPSKSAQSSVSTTPESSTSDVDALKALLQACSTTETLDFDSFLASPHLLDLLPSRAEPSFSKIGEASYSEVFSVKRGKQELVIKVVPILPVCQKEASPEVPDCSGPEDVLREVEITKRLASLETSGFIDMKGTFVVQGAYPQRLIDEWYSFREMYGTSSIRPEYFAKEQLYALIILADGGPDLESYTFDKATGWLQASGVFWQVVDALALAEEACQFEHRDLHEGQVLITPCAISGEDDLASPASTGIKATIIDFGLSRLVDSDGKVIHSSIPDDVFEGQGAQWDVYRSIRDTVDGDWSTYKPITNVMWLQYLLQYLLQSKSLVKPRLPKLESRIPSSPVRTRRIPLTTTKRQPKEKEAVNGRAAEAWHMLKGLEGVLGEAMTGKKASTRATRGQKGGVEAVSFTCAGDFLRYGEAKGWVA